MTASASEPPRLEFGVSLVRALIAEQFPQWAGLPITPVESPGWDNHTFRLGKTMSVRMPSAQCYVPQVEKEHRFLPVLAPRLPLPVPAPLAMGKPAGGYPWPWSIYRWLDGESALAALVEDKTRFAEDLAGFLRALQTVDAADGPAAGLHNFFRGGSLAVYDAETREAIAALAGEIDARAALALWEQALASSWTGPPVWVHGDIAPGNLLETDGRLSAVIDFGSAGTGDPACDLTICWTFFEGESREVFRRALPLDFETWARARGWTLWKALITFRNVREKDPETADEQRRIVSDLLENRLYDD